MSRDLVFRGVTLVSLMLAGCHHAAVAPAVPNEGTSSYRFVDPPPPPPKKAEISLGQKLLSEQIVNALPIMPLATPVYPPAALTAHAGVATVGVRITVDTTGRVSDVRASLAHLTIPSSFAEEFRAAVEAAVAQWRFRPAEIMHLETVKDAGGDFQRLASREKIEWAFDVDFTFNATGDVLTHVAK